MAGDMNILRPVPPNEYFCDMCLLDHNRETPAVVEVVNKETEDLASWLCANHAEVVDHQQLDTQAF